MKTAINYFLVILAAALASSILGGIFGAAIAIISPDFVKNLFTIEDSTNSTRYAFGVGMIWGLFIGAAVGGFASILALIQRIIKLRITNSRD